ncbi:MAG TPA: kelch repeat-containing protein, partial [bacterium]|nr:kelch repeat-containing protein [bacterium]
MIIKNYKNLSDYQMFEYCVNYDTALNPVDYFNSIFNDAAYRAFSENIHYKLANNLASFHRNKSISPTQYYIKQMNDLRTSTNESEFLNIDAMKLFRPDSKSKYVFMLESLRESVFKDYRLIIQNCKAKNFNKALDIALSNYNTESDFLKYSNIQTIAARQLISRLTILSGNIEKFYKQQSDILILQMDPHPEALLVNNEYFNPIYAEENLYLALKIDIALNSAYLYCANNNYDIAFPLLDEILSLENKAKVILNAGYKSNVPYEYGNPNHFFKFIKNFKKRLEIFSSSRENEFKSILTINNNQPENIVNTAHFISDALAKAASADIVFLPKNLFWNTISQGDFTANNLYQTLPEEISLMRGYVTGFDIKKFFDISFVPLLYKSMESHLSFYTTGILDIRYPGGVRNSIKTKNNLDFHDTELYEIIFPANELILDNAQNGSFFINAKNKGEIGNLHDILIKFFSKNKNFGNHKPTDRIFTLNKCPSNKTPEALFNIDFENYKQSNKIYSLEDQYNNNIDFLCIDFKYKDLTKYIIEFYKNKISDDYHNIYYCLYNNWNKEFIAVKKYFLSNLPDIKAKDKFSVQYYFMIAKILYNMEEYGISFKYLMAYKNSYENEDDFFTFENGSLLKDLSDKLGVKTDETIKIKIANKIYNLKNQINLLKQFYKKKIAGEKIKNEIQKTNISELDTIKLLIPRYGHCCVTDSLYLYSIGGFASDTDALGVIERLNTQTGQSEILTDKIIKRGFAAAQILNGKIYIFGGESKKQNGFRIIYDDLEIFDIESKKIILNEKMPLSLTKSASVVFEDTIYIVGGFTFQKLKFNSGVLFAYNTKSKEWSECQEMNEVKETSAIIDGDGIYIFGGANGKKSYNKIDKYSIPENSWTEEIDNLYLKIKGCPCVYYDGVVYIFGKNTGRNAWGKYHKKGFVIKYCKETGTSFSITEFKKRNFFAAALCGNKIYITGGQTINDYLPNDEIQIFDIETESFNPSLNIKKTIVQENVIRNLPHSFPKNITIEDHCCPKKIYKSQGNSNCS